MFTRHLRRLEDNVWCPLIPDGAASKKLDQAGRQRLVDQIQQWFQKNQDKFYWDEDIERLAVKGQVTEEMKRKRRVW